MYCPTCGVVVRNSSGLCPTCGATLTAAPEDMREVVEVIGEVMPDTPPEDATDSEATRVYVPSAALTVRRGSSELVPPLARAGQLAQAAWRQPAVRAAVKTSVSALALSLAMRAARQALTGPHAIHRDAARGMLPSLADIFASERGDRDGEYEVVETVFYMRRVVRR